jgi:hypothetical protein
MGMLISTAHSQTEDWQDFRSLEGKFSILFPGEPQLKVDTISTAVGPLAYHTYLYQTQDTTADNLVYLLSYCEYPEGTFHKDSTSLIDEFFEVTIDASVEAVHGELAYHTERNYRSHPGRFWRINYRSGNAVLKTRAFLVGQRYYSVQVATIRPRSLNTAGDRFMDSVRVIEEAQP